MDYLFEVTCLKSTFLIRFQLLSLTEHEENERKYKAIETLHQGQAKSENEKYEALPALRVAHSKNRVNQTTISSQSFTPHTKKLSLSNRTVRKKGGNLKSRKNSFLRGISKIKDLAAKGSSGILQVVNKDRLNVTENVDLQDQNDEENATPNKKHRLNRICTIDSRHPSFIFRIQIPSEEIAHNAISCFNSVFMLPDIKNMIQEHEGMAFLVPKKEIRSLVRLLCSYFIGRSYVESDKIFLRSAFRWEFDIKLQAVMSKKDERQQRLEALIDIAVTCYIAAIMNVNLMNGIKSTATNITQTAAANTATLGIESAAQVIGNAVAGAAISAAVDVVVSSASIYMAKRQKDEGLISEQEFNTKIKKTVCESSLKFVGGTTGSIIGQVLIPVPVFGAFVGGFCGSLIGAGIGKGINYGIFDRNTRNEMVVDPDNVGSDFHLYKQRQYRGHVPKIVIFNEAENCFMEKNFDKGSLIRFDGKNLSIKIDKSRFKDNKEKTDVKPFISRWRKRAKSHEDSEESDSHDNVKKSSGNTGKNRPFLTRWRKVSKSSPEKHLSKYDTSTPEPGADLIEKQVREPVNRPFLSRWSRKVASPENCRNASPEAGDSVQPFFSRWKSKSQNSNEKVDHQSAAERPTKSSNQEPSKETSFLKWLSATTTLMDRRNKDDKDEQANSKALSLDENKLRENQQSQLDNTSLKKYTTFDVTERLTGSAEVDNIGRTEVDNIVKINSSTDMISEVNNSKYSEDDLLKSKTLSENIQEEIELDENNRGKNRFPKLTLLSLKETFRSLGSNKEVIDSSSGDTASMEVVEPKTSLVQSGPIPSYPPMQLEEGRNDGAVILKSRDRAKSMHALKNKTNKEHFQRMERFSLYQIDGSIDAEGNVYAYREKGNRDQTEHKKNSSESPTFSLQRFRAMFSSIKNFDKETNDGNVTNACRFSNGESKDESSDDEQTELESSLSKRAQDFFTFRSKSNSKEDSNKNPTDENEEDKLLKTCSAFISRSNNGFAQNNASSSNKDNERPQAGNEEKVRQRNKKPRFSLEVKRNDHRSVNVKRSASEPLLDHIDDSSTCTITFNTRTCPEKTFEDTDVANHLVLEFKEKEFDTGKKETRLFENFKNRFSKKLSFKKSM